MCLAMIRKEKPAQNNNNNNAVQWIGRKKIRNLNKDGNIIGYIILVCGIVLYGIAQYMQLFLKINIIIFLYFRGIDDESHILDY